jgi:hypothetical protein
MEDKFNELIVLLQAYLNACKDFHYFCTSYAHHLLADEIMGDDLYDVIDEIKENMFIAEGQRPLTAKEYAKRVAKATPDIKVRTEDNLSELYKFATKIEGLANSMQPDRRAGNVILDTVASTMAHARTLLDIELSKYEDLREDLKKEENEGQNEKPVDRKDYKMAKVDGEKVAKVVRKYEDENLLVAEENTLDKLSKKLGVE